MCVLLPAWLCLILGLLPLEIQSRALTLQSLAHRHRLGLPRTPRFPNPSPSIIMPTASDLPAVLDNNIAQGDRHIMWRALLHKEPPPRLSNPFLDQDDNVQGEGVAWQRASRGRRHANSGGGRGHGQLMRVGCVLGTCQVQNLSHRLYQLIGQSGREGSSPINPRSPHSYG
ncbi:protein ADM2 [Myripristis murdjan]|uniref:protein ADM2 n=1 Tax=Myripristis murdjan TaxID=586833 RepID=UPI001175E7DA|nr:protein ADM2 [Myripristis murdjan]XP_029909732.1 protein ADM2 [Myripristis murdjan]